MLWSPQAREDLLDIYIYIGMDNPGAAERLYGVIATTADNLTKTPQEWVFADQRYLHPFAC